MLNGGIKKESPNKKGLKRNHIAIKRIRTKSDIK
jgi:hypothetical protein